MKRRDEKADGAGADDRWGLGARVAVGGVVAFGALASGFMLSRRGRRLVADTFRGARRTPLSDHVLDRFWDDAVLGRRRLEVDEPEEGAVELSGSVANDRERMLAVEVAASVPGVIEVRDRLVLDPSLVRRRARSRQDLTTPG